MGGSLFIDRGGIWWRPTADRKEDPTIEDDLKALVNRRPEAMRLAKRRL